MYNFFFLCKDTVNLYFDPELDNTPVSESEHHGSRPSIELLGVIHGQCRHIVPGGLQHQPDNDNL